MKTYMAHEKDVVRKWYVVDAEGVALGRLASKVAAILRGKNKPTFTPNVDTGDFVIVVNCDKVVLTGKKLEKKFYKYQYEAENEPKNLDCKYVFIDSPENNLYAIIDTVTNEVEITSVS